MLEIPSPRRFKDSPFRKRLAEAGIKGGWSYALDHAWLYEKIDNYIKPKLDTYPLVVDVGCGWSMFHSFLEQEYQLGVIGIDRIFGQSPHGKRDCRMDICIDFRKNNVFFNNTVDIMYWCSSIEHNSVEEIKACFKESMKALKPGGLFLATFSYAKTLHYFPPAEQMNLDAKTCKEIFGVEWVGPPDFDEVVKEYREDIFEMDTKHNQRFGKPDYDYIVGAVEVIKPK